MKDLTYFERKLDKANDGLRAAEAAVAEARKQEAADRDALGRAEAERLPMQEALHVATEEYVAAVAAVEAAMGALSTKGRAKLNAEAAVKAQEVAQQVCQELVTQRKAECARLEAGLAPHRQAVAKHAETVVCERARRERPHAGTPRSRAALRAGMETGAGDELVVAGLALSSAHGVSGP